MGAPPISPADPLRAPSCPPPRRPVLMIAEPKFGKPVYGYIVSPEPYSYWVHWDRELGKNGRHVVCTLGTGHSPIAPNTSGVGRQSWRFFSPTCARCGQSRCRATRPTVVIAGISAIRCCPPGASGSSTNARWAPHRERCSSP